MILSDDLYKLLFHSAFACYVKNRDGRYLYINEAGGKMLGRDPKEIIGLDDAQLFTRHGHEIVAKEDAMTYYASSPITYLSKAQASGLIAHPNFRAIKTSLKSSAGQSTALLGVAIYDDPTNGIQPEMIRKMYQILHRSKDFQRALSQWDQSRHLAL